MSLFGFVKNIGKSLFGKDAEAAENIQKHIEDNNPGVSNLDVQFDDGVVTLCADCESAAALQKTILMAGNIKGVEEVRVGNHITIGIPADNVSQSDQQASPNKTLTEATATVISSEVAEALEQADVEYYIIQSGDSLSKIAKQFYGDAMQYPRLFEENKEVIEDPDLIYPGQKIRIPHS